jgi:hypothetical protein
MNTLDEPTTLAKSHGKLLGREISCTRLIAKARQNKMEKNPCLARRDEQKSGTAAI